MLYILRLNLGESLGRIRTLPETTTGARLEADARYKSACGIAVLIKEMKLSRKARGAFAPLRET
jgi:hypothetical protein